MNDRFYIASSELFFLNFFLRYEQSLRIRKLVSVGIVGRVSDQVRDQKILDFVEIKIYSIRKNIT
jgi:hypothetical protein